MWYSKGSGKYPARFDNVFSNENTEILEPVRRYRNINLSEEFPFWEAFTTACL